MLGGAERERGHRQPDRSLSASIGIIVGASIGGLIVLGLIIGGIVCFARGACAAPKAAAPAAPQIMMISQQVPVGSVQYMQPTAGQLQMTAVTGTLHYAQPHAHIMPPQLEAQCLAAAPQRRRRWPSRSTRPTALPRYRPPAVSACRARRLREPASASSVVIGTTVVVAA